MLWEQSGAPRSQSVLCLCTAFVNLRNFGREVLSSLYLCACVCAVVRVQAISYQPWFCRRKLMKAHHNNSDNYQQTAEVIRTLQFAFWCFTLWTPLCFPSHSRVVTCVFSFGDTRREKFPPDKHSGEFFVLAWQLCTPPFALAGYQVSFRDNLIPQP